MQTYEVIQFLCDISLWSYPVGITLTEESSIYSQINPIPAEVLENQDMLGGGLFDPPPSKSHV